MILHMKMSTIINEWGECKVMDRLDNTYRSSKVIRGARDATGVTIHDLLDKDKDKDTEIRELRTRVEQLERILFAKRHGWVYTPEMLFK